MSLQLIAKQMEAKGRGGDSVLVHMTPGEVEGLQKLAESIGETLTVNPETGLVEANILKGLIAAGAGALGTAYFGPLGGQIAGTLAGSLLGGKDGPQGSERQGGAGRIRAGEDVQLRSPYEMPRNEKDYPYAYGEARPIVAAQGGLMRLAEGGMTGASGDAFNYLMGNAEISPAMRNAIESQRISDEVIASRAMPMVAPQGAGNQTSGNAFVDKIRGLTSNVARGLAGTGNQSGQGAVAGSGKMFSFDPATGTFVRNPNYVDPLAKKNEPVGSMNMVGRGDTAMGTDGFGNPVGGDWDSMSDAQKADYYRDNPAMGRFTRTLQEYNPFASLQERMDPGFTVRQADIALSGVPNAGIVGGGLRDPQQRAEFASTANSGPDYSRTTADAPGTDYSGYSAADLGLAAGGITSLAKGGMASGGFVVPADVVSALGNGSTDAGLRALKALLGKIKPIKGKGDGLSDSIKTNIDGKQPARVADGEAYIDPKTVKRIGGAQKLYAMMDKIRAQAHGKTTQQRKVNPAKV